MTNSLRLSRYAFVFRVLVTFLVIGPVSWISSNPSQAASGTWSQDADGLWDDATPGTWSGGVVAGGSTFTADFSQINITALRTVTLDASRSIGAMTFRDNTSANNNWVLASSGGSVLTLDNGVSQPVITVLNQTTTISAILAGTNGVKITGGNGTTNGATLALSGVNTYSGTTTINSLANASSQQFSVLVQNNSAFGTSNVVFDPGGTNGAQILLDAGVNVANSITITTSRAQAGGNGSIKTNGNVTATWSGPITINGPSTSGGDFVGPTTATANTFLILSGPIISNLASQTKATTGGNAIIIRAGHVRMADTTGTSSMSKIENRNGTLSVGANNGIATNAYIDIGGNLGNPGGPTSCTLDLNGFNQLLVGVCNYISNTQSEIITNSSTTSPATLTLAPVNPATNPNQALLVFTANANGSATNALMTDASAAFPLSLAINGDAAGVQYLTTGASNYRGTTTLTSGTLAISALANGGASSSIGASTNAATNLVFNGGTLRYVNTSLNASNAGVALTNSTTPSTDRNFTINNGTSGTINVEASGTTLTWSGGSANTTGALTKAGPGTLILTGTNQHTGGTTVSGGTLLVISPGSLSTGAVSVASLSVLGGNGTIGGTVTPASGGILAPGNPTVNSGVGTLIVGGLTLGTGSVVNFEFGSGVNDQITVSNAGGLNVTGGNLNLFNAGGITAFSTNGPYTLMNINGGLSGALSNLTVTNPTAGKSYSITSTASAVVLTIGDSITREWNNGNGTNLWTDTADWSGGVVANTAGETAKFGQLAGGGSINLNGNKVVGGLVFDNGSGYTLTGTSSTLTLNNNAAASAVTVNNGSHTIAVPVSLSKSSAIAFSNNSALTISGAIGGGQAINASGTGSLTLTANNSYSTTSVNAATLNVGTLSGTDTSGTLGSGDVTMSNVGTLNFNRSNAYNFGGGIAGSGVLAGSVNQLGNGTTTVTGAITNVTAVNVSAGTLIASSTMSQTGGITLNGTGSLTANGSVSGTGGLTMGSSGTVNLNASNSYFAGNATTAGTTVNSGTVNLNAAGALPTNSALAVNGGILNLNANNISISAFLDSGAGGIITNNGASNTTSTITFAGGETANLNYNIFAALNDGASGGKVALVTSIANTQSGNIRILHLNSTGTYSGGTTVNSQSIQADATNAFGTGPITIALNNSSTSSSQIYIAPGFSIPNNITIVQGHPQQVNITANEAVIQQTADGQDTTVSGTVTIQQNNLNGGLFLGPATSFMNVTGTVTASAPADTIIQLGGNVKYSGLGSFYPNMVINGTAALGANNGLAQNALLQFSTAPGGSTASTGVLDLNGFNQSVVALSATSGALTGTVQNSGAGTNTLILTTTGANSFNGAINGNINLTVGGTGTQTLTGGSSSYTGITTLTGSAVVEASSLSSGGGSSSIGAATSAAANLVFDGGTLRYTGGSTNIDRGFTINAGKTATFNVATAGTTLTLTGSSITFGGTTGGLTKAGPGTLAIDSATTHAYTGATTVSGGALIINNNMSNSGSIVINAGATLAGSGTIGGALNHTAGTINPGAIGNTGGQALTLTGPITLNGGTVQYDVDGSNLAGPQDVVNANGGLSVTGSSTIDLEFISPSSPPLSTFSYVLFNYTGAAFTQAQFNNLNFITNVAGRNSYANSSTASQVKVTVTPGAAGNVQWNSTSSGVWNTVATNWFNTSTNSADKFFNGDNVAFVDNNANSSPPNGQLTTAITLAGTVTPSSISVTSNVNNYTISGAGKISGTGTLTKSGSSTLTIQTNNDFSGATTINTGTVNVGGNSASGSLGTSAITNNANLIFSRTDGSAFTPLSFANSIDGTGNLTLSFPGTVSMTGSINQATLVSNGVGTANVTNSVTTTGALTVSAGAANFSGSVNSGTITVTAGSASFSAGANANSIGISAGSASFAGGANIGAGGLNVTGTGSATASGSITGTGGVTINTTGTVTLSGGNSYDGATLVTAGLLNANNGSAFGSTTGSTTVSQGGSIFVTTATTDYGLEAITINGTGVGTSNNGALHTGGATTSTFDGPITVASNSIINLDGGSTLALTNTASLTGSNVIVTLAGQGAAGTLVVNGNVNLGLTGALNLAVVTGSLNTAGSVSFAAPALANITLSSPITGTGAVASNTSGTPDQANLGTTTFAVDSPAYTGAITVNTGNLKIQTAGALGTTAGNTTISGGASAVNGSLMIAPSSGNLSIAEPFSVSGRQTGAIDVPHIENVSGNNTLTGAITPTTGGTDYNFQSDAGGSLTISSGFSTAAFTSLRNLKLQGSGDGTWNGQLVDVAAAPLNVVKTGSGTWKLGNVAGNSYRGNTTVSGGTLLMGANNVVGGAVGAPSNLILGGGKLATGGFSNTFNHLATANAVNSVIDLGAGNSSLVFANSNPTVDGTLAVWSGTLQISNWTYGSDQIKVGADATGLDAASQLSLISFDHFATGASLSSAGVLTPVVGDIDQDGTRSAADLNKLLAALTDRPGYDAYIANLNATQNRQLSNTDENFILDVNLDGSINNLDIQAEISTLIAALTPHAPSIPGSPASVPEPSTIVLLAVGAALAGFKGRQWRRVKS